MSKYLFSISGSHLDKKDVFGASDPFIIAKIDENGTMVEVFKTPVKNNTLDPTWENLEVYVQDFNKGDPDKMISFEVYDFDKNSKNDLIGTFKATTRQLFQPNNEFEIINDALREKKGCNYKNSGVIRFYKAQIIN